ncbi:MAG TPA: 2OG-Fe dioxygenase family protein [Candidatus Saccharimonadales bacterium]|nr:2OG-Fe dioxygenase family protein [Candidatus Saccharimonadales bacterium]
MSSLEQLRIVEDPEIFRQQCRERFLETGYVCLDETQVGVDPFFRQSVTHDYFSQLGPEWPGVLPADRRRAYDILDFSKDAGGVLLSSAYSEFYPTSPAAIGHHPPVGTHRQYPRLSILEDARFVDWTKAMFSLIPPKFEPIRASGQIKVDFFRTSTTIVTSPHRDGWPVVIIYVINRHGGGAETRLYSADNPEQEVFRTTLDPGRIIMLDDTRVLHSATPLIPAAEGRAQRDAIICVIGSPPLGG